jgi:hypothetical protein
LAQISGTRLRAAQLKDDRFLADVEKQLEEQRRTRAEPPGPPLEYFTTEVEALYDLSDDIRMLINAQTGARLPFRKRPEGPVDRLKDRKKAYRLSRTEQLLEGG